METILSDGSISLDPRLDRIYEYDPRSLSYGIFDAEPLDRGIDLSRREIISKVRVKAPGPHLNQGREGACHIEGTEVLTDSGWKDFRVVTPSDLLGTINQETKELEFQAPSKLVSYEYTGKVYSVKNRSQHFTVTPDHRMYIRKWDETKRTLSASYDFVTAEKLGWYSGLLPSPAPIAGGVTYGGANIYGTHIDGDSLIKFIGLFIAEGCLYNSGSYRIEIASGIATDGPRAVQLRKDIVEGIGFKVSQYNDRFVIRNKELLNFLLPYYGTSSLTKRVPEFIKSSPVDQITMFLEAFKIGDSHITKCGRVFLYTSSKQLADDLQILYLLIGERTRIVVRPPRSFTIAGRFIAKENVSESYVLSPWRKNTLSIDRKKDIKTNDYSGMVYCATVPNSTLITRLSGMILISGNCVSMGFTNCMRYEPDIRDISTYNEKFAKETLYYPAQKEDEFPGEEPEMSGTSLLAVLKVAKRLGLIKSYVWAFNLEQMCIGIGYYGAAMIGVPWYSWMAETARDGRIEPKGKIQGGHCVAVIGLNKDTKRFRIANSWGNGWGVNGECYITFSDMEKLLSERGECAFITKA